MKMRLTSRLLLLALCTMLLGAGLLWSSSATVSGSPGETSPRTCRRCHEAEYELWAESAHNTTAYAGEAFQTAWERSRQPDSCLTCHSSGYDPATGEMSYPGVDCTACHSEVESEYDPEVRDHGLRSIPENSSDCENCHGMDHALTYVEWAASSHNGQREVGCYECHVAHSGDLVADDVTTLCGACHLQPEPTSNPHMHVDSGCRSCHPAPVDTDNVHMHGGAEDAIADCNTCHMAQEWDSWGRYLSNTGHSMQVSLAACQSCHGMIHELQATEESEPGTIETIRQ
ncbi:MAG: cytochrome c3 family protein [Anaerolineae bacterium]|nr:cytochrome c3 family protein [Anaerolineae bacterium]